MIQLNRFQASSSIPMCTCRHAPKVLVVFDFDNTLVESSNRNYSIKVIPEQTRGRAKDRTMWELPPMPKRAKSSGAQQQPDIWQCLDEIEFVVGMKELVLDLARQGQEIIIISDCNSVFIGHTLKKSGLQDCIASVFTNPAWFDDKGCLRLSEHHHQDWCELCPPNLCKGHVLRNYLRQRQLEGENFLFVAYVGDGHNDYCPTLCLTEKDVVFPRSNFELQRTLQLENSKTESRFKTKCKVVPWHSGSSIRRAILDEMQRYK